MKKHIGIKKAVSDVPATVLQGMPTGALLARLKRLRWCIEDPEAVSDYTAEELASVAEKILFKSDPRWQEAYKDVKAILDTREHKTNMS